MEIFIVFGIFLLILLAAYQAYWAVRKIYKLDQRSVERRLRVLSSDRDPGKAIDIAKQRVLSEIPWLNDILARASFIPWLEKLHGQSAASRPLGVFVMLTVVLFFAGIVFMGLVMRMSFLAGVLFSAFLASAPLFHLMRKRKKRMEKFERQLPEALELVTRALRAGHAFTGGLRLVAEEFGDPIGVEFGKTVDEINFGVDVTDALMNLTKRVDCDDLKFFAVSVIVQRETGGNLAEIFESLGRLIRERFKFWGRVRVLSAEGRMSAMVLTAMPFLVVAAISLLNPDYITVLFTDSIGRVLVTVALVMMGIGSYLIKKLVAVKA